MERSPTLMPTELHTIDEPPSALDVWAPARLHWGLLNESGVDGWIDGGVGHGLAYPSWRFNLTLQNRNSSREHTEAERIAASTLVKLAAKWHGPRPSIEFTQQVSLHSGLGARTSLLLAIGKAYARLMGLTISTSIIAQMLGRGGTSGIGLQTSDRPGIVTDLGHEFPLMKNSYGPTSAALSRSTARVGPAFAIPSTWRIILLLWPGQGLHGIGERGFFQKHCPIPERETRELLDMVPDLFEALKRGTLRRVQWFLSRAQDIGLKRHEWCVQGKDQSAFRSAWIDLRMRRRSLAPLCLSSMGPTHFLLTDSVYDEIRALHDLGVPDRVITITKPSSTGVTIEPHGDPLKGEYPW